MRRRGSRTFVVAVAAGLAVTAGCTMCPDPQDYSGPVPNGSAPQNDFRARSHGIIPTGGTSRPWPTLVRAARVAPRGETPDFAPIAAEEPVVTDADDAGGDANVLPLSAAESADADAVTGQTADPEPVVAHVSVPLAEADADAGPPDIGPADAGRLEPQPAEHQPAALPTVTAPALRETPGWRPRG